MTPPMKRMFERPSPKVGTDLEGSISVQVRLAKKELQKGNITRHITVKEARVSAVADAIAAALFEEEE